MVFQDENRYRCGCSCRTLPSRCRKRIQLVLEHTSSACRPPRSTRYFSVLSSTAIPAPRARPRGAPRAGGGGGGGGGVRGGAPPPPRPRPPPPRPARRSSLRRH